MKMTPELKTAQANMAPGEISAEGFLGDDERILSTILDEDALIIRRLDMDIPTMVENLRYFMEKGQAGLGEPITVDEKWLVRTDGARGKIACPWEDTVCRKINTIVERIETGAKLYYTELSIHLLEKHGFLEGRGSAFRLHPELIKHVLCL